MPLRFDAFCSAGGSSLVYFDAFSFRLVFLECLEIVCNMLGSPSEGTVRFGCAAAVTYFVLCVCFRHALVSSSATNQRSALTTTRRMLRATSERLCHHDQSILTPDTSARFAAGST